MKKKLDLRIIARNWRLISIVSSFLATFGLLYGFRLGSHIRGDSIYERLDYLQINGVSALLDNASFGPIKFLELVMVKIDDPNATLLRIVSACTVALGLALFYIVISKWHTKRVAILTTILFGLSSYSLHLGRFTTQDALYYTVIPVLFLIGTWLKSKRYVKRLPLAMLALAVILYLPGVIYIIGALAIAFRTRLLLAWSFVPKKKRAAGAVGLLALILPLLYSFVRNPSQIVEYLAIDRVINDGPLAAIKALARVPEQLVVSGPNDAHRWLSGTPILDIATLAFIILGTYAYIRGAHTLRTRMLIGLGVLCALLIATGTLVTFALLLPVLYFLAANGISYLLRSWFTVFPKNPAARSIGVVTVCIIIATASTYQVTRYFIAWPYADGTTNALNANL